MSAPLRVLVCPQEFKGTLDAFEATAAIAHGVRAASDGRAVEVVEQPMADGGPGTDAILAQALSAKSIETTVRGAYGAEVRATLALADTPEGPLAIVESASALGLTLTPPSDREPARSTSEGAGELILEAIRQGASRLIVCVGGTATMDGGAGVARALGLRLLDRRGQPLPPGGLHLVRLDRIEDGVSPEVRAATARIAVDARNPLTGPEGAVAVYGSQKGLRDWQAPALDAAISHFVHTVREQLGREIDVPGAGTGGGITAGILAAMPQASVESGASLVAETVGLDALIERADLVVTGEGAMDAQTAYGKTVGHVATMAAEAGVPCVAVAGVVRARPEGIADAEPVVADPADASALERAMAHPAEGVAASAERLVRRWLSARGA